MNRFYLINADYRNIKREQCMFEFTASNGTTVTVSMIAIPNSKQCAVSIYQNKEPLIINRIPVVGEGIISKNTSESIIGGDIAFVYTSSAKGVSEFDIDRLGKDLLLYYKEEI
ncbi:MAG: hypothetical protein RR744_00030 [Cellulosilyticaceae bacterium]